MAVHKKSRANIKGKTRRYFEVSLVVALMLVISAFAFFPLDEMEHRLITRAENTISITDIPVTQQQTLPPPPPRPPLPFASPNATDMLPDFDSELDTQTPVGPPPELIADDDDAAETDEIFVAVEDPPTIVGGIEALMNELEYPPLARRAGVQGKVVLRVLLDKTGNVEKAEVLQSLGGGCDEAAIEAVRRVKFTPGLQRDKPVRVWITVPINFRLQ
ncbi:energy transducer TonB [bacterium]|nr:energy transducer TonB [bacterium]